MTGNRLDDVPMTGVLGGLERDRDTAAIEFDRLYSTGTADLWQICADPDRLARWFAPVDGDFRPGRSFVIRFDDDTPQRQVLACEPPTSFVCQWPMANG